jgi:hypothetical protein
VNIAAMTIFVIFAAAALACAVLGAHRRVVHIVAQRSVFESTVQPHASF